MNRTLLPVVLAVAAGVHAQSAGCHALPPVEPITVKLEGNPFKLAATPDGCWIFASLLGGGHTGLAVLRRNGNRVETVRTLKLTPGLSGLVLTHDGKVLVGSNEKGVVVLDVERLEKGTKDDAVIASVDEGGNAGSIYVNVTADDKTLFVSDERNATITVIDLDKARSPKTAAQSIVGRIPVGLAPIGLVFSPDEQWLYTTSERAAPDWGWPAVCDPEGAMRGATRKVAEGAVIVVDVARARTEPAKAVASRVAAGCVPVRLALTPSGDRAYVTARKSNAILAFDAAALTADPKHALLGTVPVGTAPVPVVVLDGGKRVVAGNSNRFGGGKAEGSTLTVVDAGKLAEVGTIVSGAFPRDLILSPDGKTLYVANFTSGSVQAMSVEHLK